MNPCSGNVGTRPLCDSWGNSESSLKQLQGFQEDDFLCVLLGLITNGFCSAQDILIKGSCSLPQAIQFLGGICNSQITPSLGW